MNSHVDLDGGRPNTSVRGVKRWTIYTGDLFIMVKTFVGRTRLFE